MRVNTPFSKISVNNVQILPDTEIIIIPDGHLWLLGDNSSKSFDSRFLGPIPINCVSEIIVNKCNLSGTSCVPIKKTLEFHTEARKEMSI